MRGVIEIDLIQTVLLGLLTTFVALYQLNVLLLLYFKLEHERARLLWVECLNSASHMVMLDFVVVCL